jgi:16S rRNA (adenine1518-N6/adenine1519-N6)-dimethyltransferase
MDPSLTPAPINVPALMRAYRLKPHKGLGQNFLTDQAILRKLTEAAEIDPQDEILEIGPGLGSLTVWLSGVARRVVAVELDHHLIPVLEEVLGGTENVVLVQGDILNIDPATLLEGDDYLVVANIPYYITSAIIRHLLESKRRPSRLVLTMQREVAERICAPAGDLSLLALSVQVYGLPRPVLHIPAGAFYPPPKVDSITLRVDLYPQPLIQSENLPTFFKLAKAGFSQKRKTLRNALSASLRWSPAQTAALLEQAQINPQRRAETLSIEEWKRLTDEYLSYQNIA